MQQYLTFELKHHVYAVNALWVNSILDPQSWTPLPRFGTLVKGLVNVRGNVVPLFDPSEILGKTLLTIPDRKEARLSEKDDGGIITFELENGTNLPFIGMEVDHVGKVSVLTEDQIHPVPEYLPDAAGRYYEGFCLQGKHFFSIVRLDALVARSCLFAQEGGNHG